MGKKVDIEEIKKARDASGAFIRKVGDGVFCRECGDTDPESGWYPGHSFSNEDVSSLLCNDCDERLRKGQPLEKIENPEGETVDEILHFIGGYKRTIFNITYIWENEMTHIITADGIEWIINKANLLCVEKIRRNAKKAHDTQDG